LAAFLASLAALAATSSSASGAVAHCEPLKRVIEHSLLHVQARHYGAVKRAAYLEKGGPGVRRRRQGRAVARTKERGASTPRSSDAS
jgi:hypothetical protein